MNLLEVKNLNLWYGGNQVLHNVSFSLSKGEVLCIVGESGSGKSSILFSILGLLPENARVEGDITFKGKNLLQLKELERRRLRGKDIGMIFQEPSSYLDPLFTVGSQIAETYEGHFPDRKKESRRKSLEAMRRAGIPKAEDKFDMYPHQLSGGLKQRVCIAMAIVCEPELLLADEPTTALDVSVQKKILTLLRKLRSEGKSVILVTHDFGVVAEVGDRVIVLKEGKVVESGDVFEVFDSPKEVYTKTLLEAI
ncbi:peptide/nickel transport system ATP-binding protein [Hydrogenivirga caldilitoris]|uniref:Peptide/nickel transport system ATP-binding protein n=1 Tax=Hydrogenivirga caldilitoris TaxID=246264 RepID=A0A497XTI1_9AQUI|nr:ABC transporter ATP-binding protein [Hydrogenivirga caldilitoris]RLJ71571.1 peptide/nickel transport system ATP-binding protein [Hydrogenivirga caldilitoris]